MACGVGEQPALRKRIKRLRRKVSALRHDTRRMSALVDDRTREATTFLDEAEYRLKLGKCESSLSVIGMARRFASGGDLEHHRRLVFGPRRAWLDGDQAHLQRRSHRATQQDFAQRAGVP
jgi:hypothetical protein